MSARKCFVAAVTFVLALALSLDVSGAGRRGGARGGKPSKPRAGKPAKARAAKRAGVRPKKGPQKHAGKRQGRQSKRIKSGVRDGSLTPREAKRLGREQAHIAKERKKAAADGKVTPREKAKLQHDQNKARRHIAKERHGAQGEMGPKPKWKTWDPGVNRRQHRQTHRIAQGIRSGSLTKDEVHTLVQGERQLAKLEREYKSDGVLTVAERKDLHHELNELSKQIFAEKHDADHQSRLRAAVRAKLQEAKLSGADAKELAAQGRRLLEIKRILGGPKELDDGEREALEEEFDSLADNLFE